MSQRIQRVSELIRAEVSKVLLRGLKDPRISGLVTVTDVWVSGDLREAKVFVSVYGSDAEKKRTLAGLQSAKAYVRREVTSAIKLRVSTSIDFELDDGIERGNAVIEKMREIGLNIDEKPRAPTDFDDDELSSEATTLDDPRADAARDDDDDEPSSEQDATPVASPAKSAPRANVDPLAQTDPRLEAPPGVARKRNGEKDEEGR